MKLCIDPGHGMGNRKPGSYDPGAQSAGVSEADVALQIALTGKWLCKQRGIACYLTRETDQDSDPVGQRDDKAEAQGCTHLLSIHLNCADGRASGTETFYRDSADKAWARKVQDAALPAWGLSDRGLKTEAASQHSRLAVLDFDGPAALLEVGFIDHPLDRARAQDRDRRIAFWSALLDNLTATTPAPTTTPRTEL